MSKEIFKELFEYYSIPKNNDTLHRAIRKTIRVHFKEAFPSMAGKDLAEAWAELSEFERQSFKLVTMRDYLIGKSNVPKKTEEKVKRDLDNTFLKAKQEISKHNNYIDDLYTQFFDPTASESENHKSYSLLCDKLKKRYPDITPQSYEEWIARPMRLFDLYCDNLARHDQELRDQDSGALSPVTQQEIDHAALECVLFLVERELRYKIDLDSIKHCLEMTHDTEDLDTSALQIDVNPSTNVSKEDQERQISYNIDLMDSIRKLREHDFIIDVDN